MAINPFRVGELQLPQPLRPVPIDFSPLQSIGEGIGQYRQQQAIGSILAGATGPDGQLDLNKAASGLAAAGFAGHAEKLLDSALRQKALTSAADDRAEQRRLTERGQDLTAGQAADMLKQRQREFDQGKVQTHIITNPDTDEQSVLETGGPNGPRVYDLKTRTWSPAPAGLTSAPAATPAPATTAPGPRSDVAPDALPNAPASFADRFDPENAPPARVAAVGPVALPSEPAPAPATAAPGQQIAQAAPVAAAPVPRPGEPGGPPLKPDTKTTRSEFAKKLIDEQATAVQAAQVAKDLQPHYDEAIKAWQELMKADAIGPYAGSTVGRLAGAYFKTNAEAARQNYDKAINRIKARISAIDFKGQGAVSNYERGLASAQFPDLTAVDPADQINFLLQGRDAARQAVATAKGTPVGQRTPLLNQEPPSISERAPEVSTSAEVNTRVGQAREHWQSIKENPDYSAAQIAAARREIVAEMRRMKIPNPEVLLGR